MLELKNITKIYNPGEITEACLFRDFNLSVEAGEFVSIVGSNGSGKTSLLNIICGSIPIQGGDVIIDGESMLHKKEFVRYRRFGRVYQNPALGTSPNLTMFENLSLADNKGKAYDLSRGANHARRESYREQLASLGLGLEDKLNIPVGSLSGGQRQALALLMSTLTPIEFLILDEHTAALDPKTAEVIMQLTGRLVREKGLTTLMVTHNLRYALEYGDRILMLHEGRAVLDKSGEEKRALKLEEVLGLFNQISVECGN